MKLVPRKSPYIRKNVSVSKMMLNVIIALVPLVLFAIIQNGWNGAYVFLASILTMIIVEIIAVGLIKWPEGMLRRELFTKEGFKKVYASYSINNILCPVITALIFSLLLPARTPVYVVIVGSIVGILFGKLVFGEFGNNIFNPAAVGFIFVKLCFAGQLDQALLEQTKVIFPHLIQNDVIAGGTPLTQLAGNLGGLSNAMGVYSIKDLLFGNVPGAMGEVCSLLILISLIYLVASRSVDLRAILSMLGSFLLVTLSVGVTVYLANGTSIVDFMLYQFLAGGLLFGAVFMITDPVTSPITKSGRVIYGMIVGILAALIRYIGAYPEGVAFALLLGNMLASSIDYFMRGKPNTYTWVQIAGIAATVVISCIIISLAVHFDLKPVEETATMMIGGLF